MTRVCCCSTVFYYMWRGNSFGTNCRLKRRPTAGRENLTGCLRSSAKRALSCAPDDWRFTNENTIPIKRAIDFGMPNLEIMKTIYAATLLFATLAHAEVTSFSILPSATDPAIKTFNNPHEIYVNRDIIVDHKDGLAQDRHELLLFLPGTHTKGTPRGQGPVAFCELAADLGYHVVTLMYPDEVAAAQFREASDPNAFEEFRMAIIQGGRTKYISIERSESIENRLVKLLLLLKVKRPKEHWEQFLNNDGTIKWEAIAVAGQSQGGGHAALIGIKHRTARVICTGAPKDFNRKLNAPAAWYGEESSTPKDHFFTFNHRQDPTGCTPKQLSDNLKALKLDAFGLPADVDTEDIPYRHSRILTTGFPAVTVTGEESEGAKTAHTSVIATKYADHWKQVWTYLLTENAQYMDGRK